MIVDLGRIWVWVVGLHGRVQSVTGVGVIGCPCDGPGVVLSCSPVSPCCAVDSRLRGNDGPVHCPSGLRIKYAMTGRCMASFSPSPLIPLPSREREIPPHHRPVDTALKPV